MAPGGSQPQQQQQPGQVHERHTIWQGVLEWIEKAKTSNDPQKLTRHLPCQVSANPKDGEPDLKADSWPQKLIMQLIPKRLIGNIGGAYLRNSKSVLFHLQQCEALESLTKVMSSGFAGCVHFTRMPSPSPCDIKVLILLYTSEKRAYLGFIPNDQAAFVAHLRKVIQHQKTTQALIRQGQNAERHLGAPGGNQQQQQQQGGSVPMRGQAMMGGPPQRPPFDHIEAARRQNFAKILHLKQALEAAQQQELQYKSQLEESSRATSNEMNNEVPLSWIPHETNMHKQSQSADVTAEESLDTGTSSERQPSSVTEGNSLDPLLQTIKREGSEDEENSNTVQVHGIKRKRDNFDMFGEFVVHKLRNLSTDYARNTVEHLISNLLYEASRGIYNHPRAT